LNDAAFAHLARTVEPGCTEQQLAWEMENFVRTHGGEDISFPPITVGGPNSAIPHAVPSARAVQDGELVLFDIGAKLNGYCSDMTRTVSLGEIPGELRDVWHVVLNAQLEATARVRPGMTGAEVDGIAREVIANAGLGERFGHGLGHGIGLEIHEPPWLTQTRGDDVLQPGMVFSIEPGVYLPGVGGVRIEDLVLLTERGAEVLCSSPKKLYLSEVLVDLNR
jgi:Xaa-Pro aminopeptidase